VTLALERPVVIGCSIGGRIVLQLALQHGAALRAVIGLESSARVNPYYDLSWLYRPDVHGGEVCAAMLVEVGARYGLVGHSERRQYHHESSELVARKFLAAKAAGLTPILCIGETLADRTDGKTEWRLEQQLQPLLEQCGAEAFEGAIVAYEPVWAIGTGKTATPEQVQAVHAFIRSEIGAHDARIAGLLPLLYGGSVKADNAAALFSQADVDGGLIGGASLVAADFNAIAAAAAP